MKTDFFKQLKEFIINEHQNEKYFIQYIRYYETFLQNKDILKPLLDDLEKWRLDIIFDDDKSGGYTYGKYKLYLWDWENEEQDEDNYYSYGCDQKYLDYYYEIELTRDDRYWGYCTCRPEDEGYNSKYHCCGNGCDWVAPSFTLRKIEERDACFKGVERDLWELEEQWSGYLDSYNERIKQEKLKRLEDQLQKIQKEKDELLNNK